MKIKALFLGLMLSQSVLAAPGVVVLAGGGPEGDIGMEKDWSYTLYKKLIDNGDTTKDGKIKVVVLSLDKPDTNFMVDYLKSMGATSSGSMGLSQYSMTGGQDFTSKDVMQDSNSPLIVVSALD